MSYRFSQSQVGRIMLYKHTENDKVRILIVYIDDIILTSND